MGGGVFNATRFIISIIQRSGEAVLRERGEEAICIVVAMTTINLAYSDSLGPELQMAPPDRRCKSGRGPLRSIGGGGRADGRVVRGHSGTSVECPSPRIRKKRFSFFPEGGRGGG